MKPKVYLETTIPSYLAARPSRDLLVAAHQQLTRDWWEFRRTHFDLYISELVIQEIRAGDPAIAHERLRLLADIPIVAVGDDIVGLVEDMVSGGPLPAKAVGDAVHIAIATIYGFDYLLTWNCRHIANAELFRALRRIVERRGFDLPALCTPEELMGERP